jgi:hypothetical protein
VSCLGQNSKQNGLGNIFGFESALMHVCTQHRLSLGFSLTLENITLSPLTYGQLQYVLDLHVIIKGDYDWERGMGLEGEHLVVSWN